MLKDLCNPSKTNNVAGKPLTQTDLTRVAPALMLFADQCLRECARRLLGRRTGTDGLGECPSVISEDQAMAWVQATEYLRQRVQSNAGQKPGRAPDMSAPAAQAFCAVLAEMRAQASSFRSLKA